MKREERVLREFIRGAIVKESYEDIVEIIVRIRVRVARESDPKMLDIMTDIRGLPNVITVKQHGELGKMDHDGRQFALLQINFVEAERYDLKQLLMGLKQIEGVDLAKIVAREGQRITGATA